jgi:predicted ATPase
METVIGLLGVIGVVAAIAANATAILRYFREVRAPRAVDPRGVVAMGTLPSRPPAASPTLDTVAVPTEPSDGVASPESARAGRSAAVGGAAGHQTPGAGGVAGSASPAGRPSSDRASPEPPLPEPERTAAARARPSGAALRTPDQRLRVFVSSTLRELAPERVAARRAIESLRLTPVMFELGARPHPPRDLYRSYLAQSDVFVAIYGQRYGWVAPGERVSGLEDEYLLSDGMPKLVYVREGDQPREAELERLLDRVRTDDQASYTPFRTPDELTELLGNDLALLLSERFAAGETEAETAASPAAAPVPEPITSFVGRETLLQEVGRVLLRPEVRLLTLCGPGGAGKSRIAIELASRLRHAFEGDVLYVSLAAVRDPELVASSLAIGIGVRESVGTSPVQAMQEALGARSALLVIDNFEHLLPAAPVVADLLLAAPRLTVLVTSRSVLRLSAETVFHVPPLGLPPPGTPAAPESLLDHDAVALFVDRARAVDPHFELDAENAAAVLEICRRVDALPLAIELAAARLRSLPPQALLARMTRRLPLLSGGPRDAPARHRTLRDTIDWSVTLLDPGERTLLARLSLFEGGASLATIERVLGEDEDVLDGLTTLVDGSLVQRLDDHDDDRIYLLETVREYAAEKLEGDPLADVLRERHARAFLDLAEGGAKGLRSAEQSQWLRWLRRDLGNLRSAMTTFLSLGATAEALRLATALRPLFTVHCHYQEGSRLLRMALDADESGTGPERAAALLALGALAWRQGDLVAALPPAEEALAAYRVAGDVNGTAAALRLLGVHAHNAGEYDLAQARLEEALELMRRSGDEAGVSNTLLSLGNVAFDRAEAHARSLYEESRTIATRHGDTLVIAYALDNLSALAWCRSDLDEAEARTDEAAVLYEKLDHLFGRANVTHRRGLLALVRGSLDVAEAQLTESLRIRTEIGEVRGSAFIQHDLARVALVGGRHEVARERFRAGLDLADRHGAPLITTLYLEGIAALLAAQERPAEALELLAAAMAWRRRARVPICQVNADRHRALLQRLRAATGSEATRRDIEMRGAAWTMGEAVARAAEALRPH